MLRTILVIALVIAAAGSAEAGPPEVQPGRYVRDHDSGTLTIRRTGQNRLVFEIESTGQNCHSCHVSGVIRGAIGHGDSWAADGRDSKCDVSFSADRTAVAVSGSIDHEECRAYCGAWADFDGTYRVPPATCTTSGRQALRDQFLHFYRASRFAQAASTLQALISQCEEYMDWIERDQVRNDLALSQYHNGQPSQCLGTLNSTLAAKLKDEEELMAAGRSGRFLPPCEFEHYFDVAKSTLFNKALCAKAVSTGR